MELIWTNVVLPKASLDEKFSKLRRRQKIEVTLQIDEIVEKLRKEFSFYRLCGDDSGCQPGFPRKVWVKRACDYFLKSGDATQVDPQVREEVKFLFKRYDDTLGHFVQFFSGVESAEQKELFTDEGNFTYK